MGLSIAQRCSGTIYPKFCQVTGLWIYRDGSLRFGHRFGHNIWQWYFYQQKQNPHMLTLPIRALFEFSNLRSGSHQLSTSFINTSENQSQELTNRVRSHPQRFSRSNSTMNSRTTRTTGTANCCCACICQGNGRAIYPSNAWIKRSTRSEILRFWTWVARTEGFFRPRWHHFGKREPLAVAGLGLEYVDFVNQNTWESHKSIDTTSFHQKKRCALPVWRNSYLSISSCSNCNRHNRE